MPQPVPTQIAVQVVEGPAGKLVAVSVRTPVGEAVYFLDEATALQLSIGLDGASRQARSGLTLPPQARLVS